MQQKGHGRERQLEASRAYAEANGLELAEDREIEDIGISAFKGANVREGALGGFLEAVRSGRVKRGSFLIVESLDRLSREEVSTAHTLFLGIVQAGINVVTLTDNQLYRTGHTGLVELVQSLVIMSRAHEESQTKSLRLSAAWKNKRAAAATLKPMTKWCPAWLRLADSRSHYELIPDRVEVVRQIFNDSADGIGIYKIAHRLNQSNTPTFNKSDGWHQSYIAKILANRAAIGEFQPAVRRDGKRMIEGETIEDYFPAIIDKDLFYRVHQAKSQRQRNGAGRKGKGFSNLFSGLATCAYCGAPMTYDNKGSGPKGNQYLVCMNSKRRRGCQGKRWKYTDFETSFMAFVTEIDFASIVDADERSTAQNVLSQKLASLEGELASVMALMDKAFALLETGAPPDFVSSKLQEMQLRREGLEANVAATRATLEEMQSSKLRAAASRDEIQSLLCRLRDANDPDLFNLRAKIASHLKAMIETLTVAPQGGRPRLEMIAAETLTKFGKEAADVAHFIAKRGAQLEQTHRYFTVGLRDSRVRIVFPDEEEPLKFRQQIIATNDGIEQMTHRRP